MKISIVIPVFNECGTLDKVVGRVRSSQTPGYEKEIIIVDDASTDGTERTGNRGHHSCSGCRP
jgi:glycosyltransferase involved in cell wall biosynthesis